MNITPIRSETDYENTLQRINDLIDAKSGTEEFDELEILTTLIEAYERSSFQIEMPDPVAVIKFVMEQRNLNRKQLEPYIGGRNRVSEVLSGKRPLTLTMIRKLHNCLGIPAELLIQAPMT